MESARVSAALSRPGGSDAKGLNNTPAKTAHKKPRKPVFPDFFYMAVVVAEVRCQREPAILRAEV
jgi:hypothetical protein